MPVDHRLVFAVSIAEVSIAATALTMVLRCVMTPVVLREFRRRMVVRVMMAGALIGCVVLVSLALRSAPLRHMGTLALAMAIVAAFVRARPAYGVRRGLPPGTLGVRASLLAVQDPDFHARAARRWGAVYKTAQIHRPVACIADMALGRALLRQRDRLRQTEWAANRLAPGGYVEFMNGAQHHRYRHLLASALEDVDLAATRPAMGMLMDAHIARAIAGAGEAGFHPYALADEVAFASLAQVVLGIPPGRADGAALSDALERMSGPIDARWPLPVRITEARDEVLAMIRTLADAEGTQADAPATSLLQSLARRECAALSDPTVVGNLLFMMSDGRAMLRRLLTWIVAMGAAHPEALRAVRDERDAEHFVLEVLRLCMSEYVYRVAASDVEVGGYRIPQGWLIRVCVRECHRRPEVFREPERFDPTRFARGEGTPDTFAPFGFEAHVCFVAPTVMHVATLFVRRLGALGEWERIADGALEHWNRHWTFWEPSTALRVKGVRR